jgi:hypothetical protein
MNRIATAAVALLVLALVGGAGAQGTSTSTLTPALALARLCVSEAGWTCFDTEDGFGIHEVLLRGSERQSIRYTSYARAYARRLFGARPHDVARLRWVGELNANGDAPPSWPTTVTRRVRGEVRVETHAPWAAYRERWLAVLARAEEVVATMTMANIADWGVCDMPVHDWGGWMDRDRAERIGLVPVRCGTTDDGTRNDFYCRPSDPECMEIDPD